jgi:hypothetical protein
MPPATLSLFSEPYSPSGNVAADGVKKLLGAPRLDLLQTLVREAVQNSCDAAKNGNGPRVLFRLRRLSPEQREIVRSCVLVGLPDHAETSDPVRDFLSDDAPWVLEICDFETSGLAGPTRADVPPAEGEHTDFVDFIRNVGSKRNTDLGGGTYGYGKSALYLASNCGLIVVDSETTCNGHSARRLIAAQLGEAHDAVVEGEPRRFTGRHWWGCLDPSGTFVDPLEGEVACQLASLLGMPARASGETGTSIMIVAPQFVENNVADVIGALQEALLWYFWPRMMRDVPASRRLDARVELDGVLQPLPAPEDTPPLDLFCEAMTGIRRNDAGVEKVESSRPAAMLGRLNIVKGFRGDRVPLRSDGESLFPETSRHIAVMRPVELVVRYFEGDPLPQPEFEWAGVFVTSSEPEIERAFADSEPPAHDDWQPEMLADKSWARRYVRVALSRIRDAAKAVAGGQQSGASGQRDGPSLAHVADLFGKVLGSANAHGAGARGGGTGGGGSGRRASSVSRPVFERLVDAGEHAVALFRTDVRNDTGEALVLRIDPSLVVDGSAASAEITGHRLPTVLEARAGDGTLLGSGNTIQIGSHAGPVILLVSMPDNGAVLVKAALEEAVPA